MRAEWGQGCIERLSSSGRSLAPLLKGESPSEWRDSVYYRYYHDPGHHNTRAHLGVRPATHKLIHYWKLDAWEMYDLTQDPTEQHNLLFDAEEAKQPGIAAKFAELKAEIERLQKQFKDEGQYADSSTWPKGGVGGAKKPKALGEVTVAEAVAAADR